jgi:ABC-2 type transport system permease protein
MASSRLTHADATAEGGRPFRLGPVLRKYGAVAGTQARSRWAYVGEQLLSNLFLAVILFVFVQLWRTTYSLTGPAIEGLSLAQMIWYFVATELIQFSLPRVHSLIEQEVRNGDLALRLNKPYAYLGFHTASFLGDAVIQLVASLPIGIVVALLTVGPITLQWQAIPVLLFVWVTTLLLHFAWGAMIGLSAFWLEDVTGLFFVMDKAKWVLGGFLLPLSLFPDGIRRVAERLPFRYMYGDPARLLIQFDWSRAGQLLCWQLLWLLIFGALLLFVFRLGARRVDTNGG